MHFKYNPALRVISTIVLSFFLWTFGGVFEVAYAVKDRDASSVMRDERRQNQSNITPPFLGESPGATGLPLPQAEVKKAEEKFSRAIEDVEKILTDTVTDTRKQRLKTKKAEIDDYDLEIRKQFKDTEGKIKDLPEEIKKRHRDFVRHYDDNLQTLKTNLDEIDRHKPGSREHDDAVKKTKAHLERTKPPKKHKALDPNKLPHRTEEPVWKEPRTKPEEFLEDRNALAVMGNGLKDFNTSSRITRHSSPILLAMNGEPTGLLSSPAPKYQNPNPMLLAATDSLLSAQSSMLLALANPPTTADLAENGIEIVFTPAIRAKAAELGNNPVKIYEYVRNNIEYEPYHGSLKGAEQTLLEKAGNDFDQASLLVALLRAANIASRYVYGTVEIPIDNIMNWVGGVTDPNTAAQILATAGVPIKLLTEGGQIKHAQFEHCWVEAYVPYGNYRGIPVDQGIKTWIPLDTSYKQYEYKRGMDLYTVMRINGEQYIMDYITDTSPSPIPAELQELFPDYSISPYQFYSKRMLDHMDVNLPEAAIEDILGAETIEQTKTIIKKEYPYLLGSLSYDVKVKGIIFSSLSNSFRHKISLTVRDESVFGAVLSYSASLPELAGKRITVTYIPATSSDEALVARYGGLLNVPPYLIYVKPVIKVSGVTVVTGATIGLGVDQVFNISFGPPNKKSDSVTSKITTGDYSSVAIQYYNTPADTVGAQMQKLQGNVASTDLDDLLGQMLHNIGVSYMHHLGFEEELYAKNFQMVIIKEPSAAIVTSKAITEYLWGAPYIVMEGGVAVDVGRNVYVPFSIDGNQLRKKDFMIVAGIGSSSWENKVLESFLNVPSVSAAKLLKTASQRGIPIFTIDSSNITALLPQLQVSAETINDIRNSVNAGKKVIVAKTSLQYNDWHGDGYIVLDPAKGSAAYLISGGLAGAASSKKLPSSTRELDALYARLCPQTRWIIIQTAGSYLGTPYRMGKKDPTSGYIDCSGLVAYCYNAAGITILNDKNAAQQADDNVSQPADYPLYADLVFFKNTYKVGISHVGIALPYDLMIHAGSSKGVTLAPITIFSSSKFAGYRYVDMPACK